MKHKLLILILAVLLLAVPTIALDDGFEDGDDTVNPAWHDSSNKYAPTNAMAKNGAWSETTQMPGTGTSLYYLESPIYPVVASNGDKFQMWIKSDDVGARILGIWLNNSANANWGIKMRINAGTFDCYNLTGGLSAFDSSFAVNTWFLFEIEINGSSVYCNLYNSTGDFLERETLTGQKNTQYDSTILMARDNGAIGGANYWYDDVTYDPTPTPVPTANFSLTAKNIWDESSITNFSAIVNGTTYHTTNGTITTTIPGNATTSITVTFYNSTYFNRTYSTYNVLASGNLEGELHQAELCLNATAKVSNSPLTGLTFYITGNSSSHCFNISAGTYEVTAEKTGWYNQTQNITINALQQLTTTIQNMSYANLTIYAIDGTTNESLSNYDLTITSTDHPAWSGETETAITNHSFNLINGTYEVSITMPGYAVNGTTANVTVNGPTNYTFTLYKSNSVRIYIKDEITNNPITENITIRWSSNTTTWENETNTGSLFIHNITPDEYELLFYGTNYSTRSYTITVGNQSTQELTAYMISSTYSTIFTIKDIDTATILDGVAITMFKQINSSWVTVESKVTDISGKAQFYYDPIAHYRFFLSNTNYDDYVFYLNPILFSTYDVFMVRSDLLNYSVDFENIGFIYSPTIFYNNQNETFTFLISSPEGLLTDYGIKLTYPGGTSTDSGVNAIGEQLTADVNITNATNYDVVVLEWNYTTSLSGTRTYIVNLPIITNSTPGTWLSNKDKTYGLGLFERLLIATIIVIFTVGIATMVGQVIPGVAIGLFLFGFLVFIGFVPLWAILPSMLVGILFLIWKSGGY